jgi:hypothetical protein
VKTRTETVEDLPVVYRGLPVHLRELALLKARGMRNDDVAAALGLSKLWVHRRITEISVVVGRSRKQVQAELEEWQKLRRGL